MRKSTLLFIFIVVGFATHHIVKPIFETAGIRLPFWQHLVLSIVAALVLTFVVEFVLLQFHRWLLEWRKARGRDIEDEERYESDLIDNGMISLTPNEEPTEKE